MDVFECLTLSEVQEELRKVHDQHQKGLLVAKAYLSVTKSNLLRLACYHSLRRNVIGRQKLNPLRRLTKAHNSFLLISISKIQIMELQS